MICVMLIILAGISLFGLTMMIYSRLVWKNMLADFGAIRMNNNTYYFITGISNREPKLGLNRNRCWGFFDDFAEAEKAVLENDGDIYENEFEHMVIEGHKMGVMGIIG